MGTVIMFLAHRHARPSSGKFSKSSAVISPPEKSLSFLMVDQSGLTFPRLMRLIVTRDTLMADATCSSAKPLDSIKLARFAIPDLYARRTFYVKLKCTSGVVYKDNPPVHHMYMAAKSKKKPKNEPAKAPLTPTKIRAWREWREMTLEETAAAMSEFLRSQGIEKGYTHNSLGRLERAEFQYTQQVMEAVSHALGVNVGFLISVDPPPKGEPIPVWIDIERAPSRVREEIEEHANIVLKRMGIQR